MMCVLQVEKLVSASELLGSTSKLLGSIAMNVTCSSFLCACIRMSSLNRVVL